ncbi:DUF317 domain-containing protein [Streptomyces zaehneri]|uniref:DUF317 domain-containing protein n=1 Tax=Streptomyces zaehneri TaxID=3051180 RepID=UPI0028D88967|nr:DUF317 domain-containing protein [Streptomyces sp. DSM 40713]
MPRVLLSSPDQKAHLRLEPDPDDQWWTLHHVAESDRPEPLTRLTTHTERSARQAGHRTATTASLPPTRRRTSSGWEHRLIRKPDSSPSPLGTHQKVWQARFSARTPPDLVASFTVALADPKLVHRTDSGRSLPALGPNVVTRKATDVLAVYVVGALEDRVHSPAARHTTTPTALIPSRASAAQARPQPLTIPSPPGST